MFIYTFVSLLCQNVHNFFLFFGSVLPVCCTPLKYALDMCLLACSKLTEKLEGSMLVWRAVPYLTLCLGILIF